MLFRSDDHNFVVRYIPGSVHQEAHGYWTVTLLFALSQLTPPPHAAMPPGCMVTRATSMLDTTHILSLGFHLSSLSLSIWIEEEAGRCWYPACPVLPS